MGWFEGDSWRLTLTWNQHLNQEEALQVGKLEEILCYHHPRREIADQVNWDSKQKFTPKKFSSVVQKANYRGAMCDNLVASVWMR